MCVGRLNAPERAPSAAVSYFTEIRHVPALTTPRLVFTASRFVVECPWASSIAPNVVAPLLEGFYRERAEEKLPPRVRHWERELG